MQKKYKACIRETGLWESGRIYFDMQIKTVVDFYVD